MMDSAKGDNDGYYPHEETILASAPLAYQTPFAVRGLVKKLTAADLPVMASNSAGLYVCNRIYFEALHLGQQALFVHIPNTMDISKAIRTIEEIVKLS